MGNQKAKELSESGFNVILYLINDSYDALTERQLRIAVNKDERLVEKFKDYCGRPIAEIPDPYGCCGSYAEHFLNSQISRLNELGIQPVVLDAYKSYKQGSYKHYVRTTFDYYEDIQNALSAKFDSYNMRNLFRAQCSACGCISETDINSVDLPNIHISCKSCGESTIQSINDVQGKLSWKLDCAARWNMFDIDFEAFSKAHITDLGSFEISKFISEEFFGGNVPEPLKYGEVKIARELSYKLLRILPPNILKRLFTENQERDLELTKESVEHFCRRYAINKELSYVDFIKKTLPVLALEHRQVDFNDTQIDSRHFQETASDCGIDQETMVTFGNRFSAFYYGRTYDISFSGASAINSGSLEMATQAIDILNWTIVTRESFDVDGTESDKNKLLSVIRRHIDDRRAVPGLYPYMRRIFDQKQGASIPTLLATLPADYLKMICMAIGYFLNGAEDGQAVQREIKIESVVTEPIKSSQH